MEVFDDTMDIWGLLGVAWQLSEGGFPYRRRYLPMNRHAVETTVIQEK
jgi:hypothetical protein